MDDVWSCGSLDCAALLGPQEILILNKRKEKINDLFGHLCVGISLGNT
jgi:hypothetical protein